MVHGRFGRRGGGAGTSWLSPDAYSALSPSAKRALHFERAQQRHNRQYRPTPARYRKGYYGRQRLWLAAAMFSALTVAEVWNGDYGAGTSETRQAATAVTATFGLCHGGGGTNCVVDGDTFYLGGDKVRIAGIDAPETHPPRCIEEAQMGEAATEKLRELLNSGAVTMTNTDRDRDTYGRLLRNVAVDGADVGAAMIGAGVAREYGDGRRPWC